MSYINELKNYITFMLGKYKLSILIASVHFIVSILLKIDKIFFKYDYIKMSIIITKIIYFFLLIIIYGFIYNAILEIKNKNSIYCRAIKIFLLYSIFILIIALIMWPGTWTWDDALCLNSSQYYSFGAWQHFITGLMFCSILNIFPSPGFIIVFYNIIVSIIISYIITSFELNYNFLVSKNKVVDIVIKLFPFILLPVIFYQLSGYRQGILMYLELYILVTWLLIIDKKRIGTTNYLAFLLITSIVSTWRAENFLYVYIVTISILFLKGNIKKIYKILSIIFIIALFILLNMIQTERLGNSNYNLISLDNPASVLVRNADLKKDRFDINLIGRAFNIDVILNEKNKSGTTLYWEGKIVKKRYDKDDYKACLQGIINLSLKYPHIIIEERFDEFMEAVTKGSEVVDKYNKTYNFFGETDNSAAIEWRNFDFFGGKPLVLSMRKMCTNIIFLRNSKQKIPYICSIVWNALIPIVLLLIVALHALCKKNFKIIVVLLPVILKLPITILTEPSPWFMYYLTYYLTGYFIIIYYFFSKKLD